jgi:hypothetical protein
MRQKFVDFLTLFTSFSTLICCAIPALLVALGLGATLAGLVSNFPQIVWISEHKIWVFSLGFIFLSAGGILQKINQNAPCPLDPALRDSCLRTRKNSLKLYIFSVILYFTGFFFAFIAPILVK